MEYQQEKKILLDNYFKFQELCESIDTIEKFLNNYTLLKTTEKNCVTSLTFFYNKFPESFNDSEIFSEDDITNNIEYLLNKFDAILSLL
jgi:hypothetical protein